MSDNYEIVFNLIIEELADDDDFLDDGDDGDVMSLMVGRNKRNTVKKYWETIVPSYTDAEFKESFRIKRSLFNHLVSLFIQHPIYTSLSRKCMSADKHIGIFLWYVAHESVSFRTVKDRFDISLGTVHAVLIRVSYFISSLSDTVINWPNLSEKKTTADFFLHETGFPNVIGCLDGTHFVFDPPVGKVFDYYNRKKQTSIQGQAICDHQKKIIDFFVGFPGKVHDARVFRNSPIFENLSANCEGFYILADSAYPCSDNVLTPYKNYGNLNESQIHYNNIHSKTRISIEHTFGLLKQRFRQLYYCKVKSFSLLLHLIRACVVLHNLCIDFNDIEPDPDIFIEPTETSRDTTNGVQTRDHVCNLLWNNRRNHCRNR